MSGHTVDTIREINHERLNYHGSRAAVLLAMAGMAYITVGYYLYESRQTLPATIISIVLFIGFILTFVVVAIASWRKRKEYRALLLPLYNLYDLLNELLQVPPSRYRPYRPWPIHTMADDFQQVADYLCRLAETRHGERYGEDWLKDAQYGFMHFLLWPHEAKPDPSEGTLIRMLPTIMHAAVYHASREGGHNDPSLRNNLLMAAIFCDQEHHILTTSST